DGLLNLLLAAEAGFRGRSQLRVEAEPDSITIAQKLADWLLPSQLDMLPLVILDEQFQPCRLVVQVKAQAGFGERARQRLAGFELNDLVGQVVRGARVGGGEAQTGQTSAHGLAVK